MSSDPKLDLRNLSDHDLLQGLSGHVTRPPTPVDRWLVAQGYYPGTTRIEAYVLYLAYREWRYQQTDITSPIEAIRVWGKFMTGKFKTGRTNRGKTYYISRQSVCGS